MSSEDKPPFWPPPADWQPNAPHDPLPSWSGDDEKGWREWVLASDRAILVSRIVCVATGIGAVVAAAIVVADLVREREISGITFLLILAVPTVAVGQFWGIAILIARQDRATGERPGGFMRRSTERDPRRFFFSGLPLSQANGLLALATLAAVSALTAAPHFSSGTPTSPSGSCPYRLEDGGENTCVSRSTYLAAGAASQRFATSILGAFFVIQFGIATAELRRRKESAGGKVAGSR